MVSELLTLMCLKAVKEGFLQIFLGVGADHNQLEVSWWHRSSIPADKKQKRREKQKHRKATQYSITHASKLKAKSKNAR